MFKINMDGTGFGVLHYFTGNDGSQPSATLAIGGNILYGTTTYGGVSNRGNIFQLNTDGSRFAVLKEFTGFDGATPLTRLMLSGRTLYGATKYGGTGYNGSESSGSGLLFSLTLDPPSITSPPQSLTVEAGGSARFVVAADGVAPLSYQWLLNGVELAGCTNSSLLYANPGLADSGVCSVVVTDPSGAATNASAALSVIPAVDHRLVPALVLGGELGSVLNVEYASALNQGITWSLLETVSLTSASQWYFDVSTPSPAQRFYRISQPGPAAMPPSLKLPWCAPAITLTGRVGEAIRVDCINAFGPTNAWVTLDTVTLTNASQHYFDLGFVGQPYRLYRLVAVP